MRQNIDNVRARLPIVLIVEDDPRLQTGMCRALARMGFGFTSALHYEAALRHLAAARFDLVCIDICLPNQSGYELCEYIRSSVGLCNVPIIVTSEYGSVNEMACAEQAGGNAFLRKPFSKREFARCVVSLIERAPIWAGAGHELVRLGANGQVSAPLLAPPLVSVPSLAPPPVERLFAA